MTKKIISSPFPTAGYAVVIGAAGTAGVADAGAGGDGGDTTFTGGSGANVAALVAKGGKGAGGDGIGGIGQLGSGGDFNIPGRDGAPGVYILDHADNTYQNPGAGGNGGASIFGGGGRGGFQAGGRDGSGYGSGGGGGGRVAGNNKQGGAGAPGICVVKELISRPTVKKKLISGTPRVPEVGDLVLLAQHLGSTELPKCIGVLQSFGFAGYDAGLE
jgi:hypothetical protein